MRSLGAGSGGTVGGILAERDSASCTCWDEMAERCRVTTCNPCSSAVLRSSGQRRHGRISAESLAPSVLASGTIDRKGIRWHTTTGIPFQPALQTSCEYGIKPLLNQMPASISPRLIHILDRDHRKFCSLSQATHAGSRPRLRKFEMTTVSSRNTYPPAGASSSARSMLAVVLRPAPGAALTCLGWC